MLVLLMTVPLMQGCLSTTEIKLSNECVWADIIRPSRQDVLTTDTKRQILAHNVNYENNCITK